MRMDLILLLIFTIKKNDTWKKNWLAFVNFEFL